MSQECCPCNHLEGSALLLFALYRRLWRERGSKKGEQPRHTTVHAYRATDTQRGAPPWCAHPVGHHARLARHPLPLARRLHDWQRCHSRNCLAATSMYGTVPQFQAPACRAVTYQPTRCSRHGWTAGTACCSSRRRDTRWPGSLTGHTHHATPRHTTPHTTPRHTTPHHTGRWVVAGCTGPAASSAAVRAARAAPGSRDHRRLRGHPRSHLRGRLRSRLRGRLPGSCGGRAVPA